MTELEQEVASREAFLFEMLKKNELLEFDLVAEAEKIGRKKSALSARKRKFVLEAVEFRRLTDEMKRIAEATNA